jgi:hypothetical protein
LKNRVRKEWLEIEEESYRKIEKTLEEFHNNIHPGGNDDDGSTFIYI